MAKGILKIKLLNKFLPNHILDIYRAKIILPIGIEELFPPTIWQNAKAITLLKLRDITKFINPPDANTTITEYINSIVTDDNLKDYILFHVDLFDKTDFKDFLDGLSDREKDDAYQPFTSLVQSIEDFFA